jgi:hypothetical protein
MLAIVGIALTFWGGLLFYVGIKNVPIGILNAATISALQNTERVLANLNTTSKGVYLPPKFLNDFNNSLIYVPLTSQGSIPKPEDVSENVLYSQDHSGLLLIPPGLMLSKMMERELGMSFTQVTLEDLLERIPALLIEDMEIVDKIEAIKDGQTVRVTVVRNLLDQLCIEMSSLPITHQTIGCTFTSAIACALAKASGKPVTINMEQHSPKWKTTIDFIIMNE